MLIKATSTFYPKQRTFKECTKTDCERHSDYIAWQCGNSSLPFCMACKHAHVSQYKRASEDKVKEQD